MIVKQQLEEFLKKLLPIYIFFIFIVTALNSYLSYLSHNAWQYGDWLINYQSGFVRRGFTGEFAYQISSWFDLDIGMIVFLLHSLFYGMIFYYSYRLLAIQDKLIPYIFLIFSPFIFNFQVFDSQGGFRKEIIFLAFLALVMYWAKIEKGFNNKFFIILCIYPFAILSHEMLFFFMPYLYIAYFYANSANKQNVKKLILFSLPSILVFFVVFIFGKSSAEDVKNIFLSLDNIGYSISGGAIDFLDKDIFHGLNWVQEMLFQNKYYIYLFITLFSFFAFIPLKNKIIFIFNNKLFFIFIISSLVMSLSLFLVAIDWGRWIYIHLFSIFLVTLLINDFRNDKNSKYIIFKNILSKIPILIISVILYSFTWHIPHCCSPSSFISVNLKQKLISGYAKPFTEVISYVNASFKPLIKEKLK